MQIDAIVSDLDDTLLGDDIKLSPYTLDIFARAKARGIRIIPASGRALYSMKPYVQQLDTGMPYISCNGAQLVNADHTPMQTFAFKPEEARAIVRYLTENHFYTQCYLDDYFYYSAECDASANYKRSSGMHGQAVGDLERFITFETPKLLSVQEPAEIARMYPIAQAAFPNAVFTISKPYFLEAQPKGVSKGAALRALANKVGLTPEHTLVFGDSLNDLSMLGFAVNSVAMGNARDEVKQAAKFVCDTNANDGVARFIERNVLS